MLKGLVTRSTACSIVFKDGIYLFLEWGEGREKEKERNVVVRETWITCLSHVPNWGPDLQPRHVP